MGKILRLTLCAAAAWCLWSCNTSGCTDLRSAIPLAEFYSSAADKQISLDSLQISGIGAPGDSVMLAAGTAAQEVYLPMRSQQTSTSWCISYKWEALDNPEWNDTLTFRYHAEPYFASSECGAMYIYHLEGLDYTTHLIDSIAVLDSVITNIDAAQLRIYFNTADE